MQRTLLIIQDSYPYSTQTEKYKRDQEDKGVTVIVFGDTVRSFKGWNLEQLCNEFWKLNAFLKDREVRDQVPQQWVQFALIEHDLLRDLASAFIPKNALQPLGFKHLNGTYYLNQ